MLTYEGYGEAIRARKALRVQAVTSAVACGMKTLEEAGWDGDFVTPNQLSSRSFTGPLILLNNWYGWEDLDNLPDHVISELSRLGYLPGIPTNRWLDRALAILGLDRADVYITQACHFLPRGKLSGSIPPEAYRISVECVLKLELGGRTPVALGTAAQNACRANGISFVGAQSPSYQGGERRAQEIAAAIRSVM